jgi:hypothetical protein
MHALRLNPGHPFSRPEDEWAARALERVLHRSSTPIKHLARCLDRSEQQLHAIRRGGTRVGVGDVLRLPHAERRAYVEEIVRECGLGLELYEPIDSPEDLVNTLQKLLAESGKAVEPLLPHAQSGVIERKDAARVRELVGRIAELARAVERYCDTAEVDGVVRLPTEKDAPR